MTWIQTAATASRRCSRRFASSAVSSIRSSIVGGQQRLGESSRQQISVIAPCTGDLLCSLPQASSQQIDESIAVAQDCVFHSEWGRPGAARLRSEVLRKMADLLAGDRSRMAAIEAEDAGKPLSDALVDIDTCVQTLRYYSEQAVTLVDAASERSVKALDDAYSVRVLQRPIGVVAAITPWNFPLLQGTLKYAAAMAAGAAVIAKPPELAPLTCLELGAMALEAGAHPGALQVLVGDREVGAELVSSPHLDYISFTGSERGGMAIMKAAAENVCPVALELGGKSAAVIFPDANLDTAVPWALLGAFMHSGQVCSATSRLLVHQSLYDEVVDRVRDGCSTRISVGEDLACDQWFEIGAMISEQQLQQADTLVQRAVADGARVMCGGSRIDRPGFFYEPTVLLDAKVGSEIWFKEVFGPVLTIHPFRSDDEAIALCNHSAHGLAAAVFTDDSARLRRIEEEVRVGALWVNCSQPIDIQVPWGGMKRSGFGREMGPEGMHEYLTTKSSMRCSRDFFPA